MRATELLGSQVIDETERSLGPVRDVRIWPEGPRFRVAGIVVCQAPLARTAHAWGFAEGRAAGPWPLGAVTARARGRSRFIAAERVLDWGPGVIRIAGDADNLPLLSDEVRA